MSGHPFVFVSDLHGRIDCYRKLFSLIRQENPKAIFLGGDLLPSGSLLFGSKRFGQDDFVNDFLLPELRSLRVLLKKKYPRFFLILGNDDARSQEAALCLNKNENLWDYMHFRKTYFDEYPIYGYSCVPPTPFTLKDWERYDVSRFVDPGSIPPEEGRFSVDLPENESGFPTIQEDLEKLAGQDVLTKAVFLFHSPPYQTHLDRAALDGCQVDNAPLDVHVGSIAIRRFIEARQPLVTLHGHVHESARLTGSWQEKIGRTFCFSAAHDGAELAVVFFDPQDPSQAIRRLL
ncbi:MAG: metallophosphoesterase [Candidatus Aminicenantes bacterium]|nr:metallophosphoesterase [Candidatus Aminicenantes bacterium]